MFGNIGDGGYFTEEDTRKIIQFRLAEKKFAEGDFLGSAEIYSSLNSPHTALAVFNQQKLYEKGDSTKVRDFLVYMRENLRERGDMAGVGAINYLYGYKFKLPDSEIPEKLTQ